MKRCVWAVRALGGHRARAPHTMIGIRRLDRIREIRRHIVAWKMALDRRLLPASARRHGDLPFKEYLFGFQLDRQGLGPGTLRSGKLLSMHVEAPGQDIPTGRLQFESTLFGRPEAADANRLLHEMQVADVPH